MALKGDRYEVITDISYFMDSASAERGGCVCFNTVGSGAALDQASAEVEYSANPSGHTAMGILLNDMVNLDLTRQHLNQHKNEVQKGGKVTILQDGWVVTNYILTGQTPAAGLMAYVSYSGYLGISTGAISDDSTNNNDAPIGVWLSSKDEDGYAKVYVKLPRA